MTKLMLLGLLTVCAGNPDSFHFDDVEQIDGRSVVHFRALEMFAEPVLPVRWEVPQPEGTKHSLVIVGPRRTVGMLLAWQATASGRGVVWLDANGDHRFTADERHPMPEAGSLAIEVSVAKEDNDPKDEHIQRTLLFRSDSFDASLKMSVRGCASGSLTIGKDRFRALLTDHDADGCFTTAGVDRIWVDLNGDGRFEPATEAYPLGKPIVRGQVSYTVISDEWGAIVEAHERDARLGKVHLALTPAKVVAADGAKAACKVERAAVSLVNRWGELVVVRSLMDSTTLPVGEYRVDSMELEALDATGDKWTYSFKGGIPYGVKVEAEHETSVSLLEGLGFRVSVDRDQGVLKGDLLEVSPKLDLASGLYLANCTRQAKELSVWAVITLRSSDGITLDTAVSGFA